MKKTSLIALGIGGALIVCGLAMSSFNVSRIQHDLKTISRKGYATKSASFDAQPVQIIKTDLGNASVTINQSSASDKVSVDYFESKKDKFAVTSTNGTVLISRLQAEQNSDFMCFFRCIDAPGKIVINVPADSAYVYDLTANNASVRFENSATLHAKSVRVQSSNGRIQLERLITAGDIELQSDNGSTLLQDIESGGQIDVHSSNGRNQFDNVKATAITTRSNNGRATLTQVTAKNLAAHTSNGSITFERLAVDHVTVTSNNGSVQGDIVGSKDDYNARITSNNGSVTVDNHTYDNSYFLDGTRQKSLSVTSSNGSIRVNFGQ